MAVASPALTIISRSVPQYSAIQRMLAEPSAAFAYNFFGIVAVQSWSR